MAENEFVPNSDECLVAEAINLDIEEVSIFLIVPMQYYKTLKNS